MTAEQLRNSILQEAISGRLVPQNPNDEPASVLLERIVAEQNKTLPPKKKKSVSLIAEPEDITPVSGWAYFYIKDLFDTTSGGTPIKGHPEYYDGDIPWVRSGELNSLYLYDSELRITEAGLKNSSAKYFPVDTVVIAMYGATIGKTSIFKRSMTTNQAICGIFPIDGILPEYIYYFLQNKKRDYCSIAFGSGQPNISQEKIKNTIFPLPPLAEQKRIVAKLEELLPIVEQYGKAQKELDELNAALPARLRQSILQEAISGHLVPQDPNDEPASALLQRIREEKARRVKEGKLKKKDLVETPITDDEKPFEIPSSWIWVRYQDIADCALGKTKNPNQTDGELCPYLCSINVYWDSVRLNVLKEMLFSDTDKQKYYVEKGNMLICEGGEAGRTAIYEGNISPLYYQNALHRVRFYGDICARFYLYQMELYKKTGLLTEHIKGETIQHFVSAKLLNLAIPLPPLAEQQRIVAKIEELLADINKISK